MEEPIDEESGLDGDSYVATTQGKPFGASIEEEVGEIEDERREESGGMTALLGELYDGGGKRW